MGSGRSDLRSGRLYLGPGRSDLGSGRVDFGPGRPDLGSGRPYLRSGMRGGDNEMIGIIALCGIIGHLPLQGRCPKSAFFKSRL